MKKIVVAVLFACSLLQAGAVVAAEGPTNEAAIEQEIKLLRQDLHRRAPPTAPARTCRP